MGAWIEYPVGWTLMSTVAEWELKITSLGADRQVIYQAVVSRKKISPYGKEDPVLIDLKFDELC